MPRTLPRQLIVEVDTREKRPIPFPSTLKLPRDLTGKKTHRIKIITKTIKLPFGDYRLKDYPTQCVIERKAGQSELLTNLRTRDYRRFLKALVRLSISCEHPTLLIESSPHLLATDPYDSYLPQGGLYKLDQEAMIQQLARLISDFYIHLILIGEAETLMQRENLGLFCLNMMVGYALRDILGISLDKPKKSLYIINGDTGETPHLKIKGEVEPHTK